MASERNKEWVGRSMGSSIKWCIMCLNAAAGDVVSAVTALLTARSKGESQRDLTKQLLSTCLESRSNMAKRKRPKNEKKKQERVKAQ